MIEATAAAIVATATTAMMANVGVEVAADMERAASTGAAVEMDMEVTAAMAAVEMDMEMAAVAAAMAAAREIRIEPDVSHNAHAPVYGQTRS